MLYCVAWVIIATGFSGQGQPLSYELAHQWAVNANRKYPKIAHRVVPCNLPKEKA